MANITVFEFNGALDVSNNPVWPADVTTTTTSSGTVTLADKTRNVLVGSDSDDVAMILNAAGVSTAAAASNIRLSSSDLIPLTVSPKTGQTLKFADIASSGGGIGVGSWPVRTLTSLGVVGNGVADDADALVAAFTTALAGNYSLIGAPGLVLKMTKAITLPIEVAVDWNGAVLDFSALTALTGNALTLTTTLVTAPQRFCTWDGLSLKGPPRGSSSTAVGLYLDFGTQDIKSWTCNNLTINAFSTGLGFGRHVFTITFNDFWIHGQYLRGIDLTPGAGSGENVRFNTGVVGNVRTSGSGTGTAEAVFQGRGALGETMESYFDGVSFDYSDYLIHIKKGTMTLSQCHLENGGDLPMVTVEGVPAEATFVALGCQFYQPGSGAVQYPETNGGRPSIISMIGGWDEVILSGCSWIGGGSFGNPNTKLIDGSPTNKQCVVHGLTVGTGQNTGTSGKIASLGLASPTLDAGSFTGSFTQTLQGWQNDAEVNLFRNSAFAGAVAGTPGTQPTNFTVNGTGGLTINVIGVSYASGKPELQIQLTGTSDGTNPQIYIDAAGIYTTKRYDKWQYSVNVRHTVAPVVTGQCTFLIGLQERDVSNVFLVAGAAQLDPQLYKQQLVLKYDVAQATVSYLRPYIQLLGAAFTNGNTVNITVGVELPEMAMLGAPITTNAAQVTSSTGAAVPGGRYGIDTSGSNAKSGTNALHMWNTAGTDFSPLYLQVAVVSGRLVQIRGYYKFANYVSGSVGLWVDQYDIAGNLLSGSTWIDGSGASSSGSTTYAQYGGYLQPKTACAYIRVRPKIASGNLEVYWDEIEVNPFN